MGLGLPLGVEPKLNGGSTAIAIAAREERGQHCLCMVERCEDSLNTQPRWPPGGDDVQPGTDVVRALERRHRGLAAAHDAANVTFVPGTGAAVGQRAIEIEHQQRAAACIRFTSLERGGDRCGQAA